MMSRSTFLPDAPTLDRLLARLGLGHGRLSPAMPPVRLSFPSVPATLEQVAPAPEQPTTRKEPAAATAVVAAAEGVPEQGVPAAAERQAGFHDRPTVILPAAQALLGAVYPSQPAADTPMPPASAETEEASRDWSLLSRGPQSDRLAFALDVMIHQADAVAGFIVDQDGLPLIQRNVEGALPALVPLYSSAQKQARETGCQQHDGSLMVEISATEQLRLFWIDTDWGRYGAGLLCHIEAARETSTELQKILENALMQMNAEREPQDG